MTKGAEIASTPLFPVNLATIAQVHGDVLIGILALS